VDEQGIDDVDDLQMVRDRDGDHRDQLRGVATDNGATENDARRGIGQDLHEPARVAVDQRLRVRGERHLRHPQLAPGRERLCFGDADLGDLGVGEDRLRGLVVVEMAVRTRRQTHHVLGDLPSLHRRYRRQR
jgi:hypothetical protein